MSTEPTPQAAPPADDDYGGRDEEGRFLFNGSAEGPVTMEW